MVDLRIKKVLVSEVNLLQNIAKETFVESFAEFNTLEDMEIYIEKEFSSEKLTQAIQHLDVGFYFAMIGSNVLGYMRINSGQSQTDINDENSLEIERIYILKKYQSKKVGQKLLNKALEIAKKKKNNFLWLGVWENNFGAINFYKSHEFQEFGTHVFKLGSDEQTDLLMKFVIR